MEELVKFAAEKLGIEVSHDGKQYCYAEGSFFKGCPFDLKDWSYLGQGMAVFEKESLPHGKYTKILQIHMTHILIDDFTKKHVETFQALENLPLAFWKAWHQFENVTAKEK